MALFYDPSLHSPVWNPNLRTESSRLTLNSGDLTGHSDPASGVNFAVPPNSLLYAGGSGSIRAPSASSAVSVFRFRVNGDYCKAFGFPIIPPRQAADETEFRASINIQYSIRCVDYDSSPSYNEARLHFIPRPSFVMGTSTQIPVLGNVRGRNNWVPNPLVIPLNPLEEGELEDEGFSSSLRLASLVTAGTFSEVVRVPPQSAEITRLFFGVSLSVRNNNGGSSSSSSGAFFRLDMRYNLSTTRLDPVDLVVPPQPVNNFSGVRDSYPQVVSP